MMNLNFVVIGIIFGIILTLFVGIGCNKDYYRGKSNHWIPQTIISGLIIIPLLAYFGKIDNTNMSIEKSIKKTITTNYNNVLNYHNEEDNKSFVSGDIKYTFDYDNKEKTLIIFNGSSVNATFVDGVKQKNSK